MATQTLIMNVVASSYGQARLEADYDDTSDPLDPDLILMRVVNEMSRPCYILIQRVGQDTWFEGIIPEFSTQFRNAGGPIQQLSDLPIMMLTTR